MERQYGDSWSRRNYVPHTVLTDALTMKNLKKVRFCDRNYTSTAEATRRMLASPHGRPISCKPIGSPCLS